MTQINLHWINSKTIPYLIIAVLLAIIFMQNSCEPNTQTVKVKVLEVKGKSPIAKPTHTVIAPDKPFDIPKENNDKDEIDFLQKEIDLLIQENEKLSNEFAKESDSLKQLLYDKAIAINYYEKSYDNEYIEINASGLVRGEIQTIKFDYTIKERTIETQVPTTRFKLLGSVEMGNTKQFDSFLVKANLEFQNAKGNSLLTGLDTEQRIWLGYKFKIFQIK